MRFYDAGIGRFLQRDLLGTWQGMNPYVYAKGDSIRMVDPSGLRYIGVEICVNPALANIKGARFNARMVEKSLQKILDQCADPCKRDRLVAKVRVCAAPPADQGIVERDISTWGHLPWYAKVGLAVEAGLIGAVTGGVGFAAVGSAVGTGAAVGGATGTAAVAVGGPASSDSKVESWTGYVQPGRVPSTGVMHHSSGQPVTNADTGMIESRFGASGRPIADVWAETLAHEQLWHGLLGRKDKTEPGSLGDRVGAWKASKPRGITPKECRAIWEKLRE